MPPVVAGGKRSAWEVLKWTDQSESRVLERVAHCRARCAGTLEDSLLAVVWCALPTEVSAWTDVLRADEHDLRQSVLEGAGRE